MMNVKTIENYVWIKHRHRWRANSRHMWGVPEDFVLFEKTPHSMQLFSQFRKSTSYTLHIWRQYLLSFVGWRPFCLEKFLRVQVPLGCVKTAFVTHGLGSREFVKTMEVSTAFRYRRASEQKGLPREWQDSDDGTIRVFEWRCEDSRLNQGYYILPFFPDSFSI